MPDGANGFIWRIVLDPRIPDGFADVHAHWDLDDVAHATTMLTRLDALKGSHG